jgi:hypothetical protein
MIAFDWRYKVMLGGSRNYKFVWVDGKPPRYWVFLAILFFVLVWLLVFLNFEAFGRPSPDSLHTVATWEASGLRFYPAILIWLQYRGLFLAMAWLFVLAVTMAFNRIAVRREKS